ncbi:hypothetical protein NOCA2770003 [metagenome]|uniref:Uncharacterized protein n=1 Tax=metagenome TaxID=256318 RepID=A0A2P2CEQ2_9ZZZZ
MSTTTLPDVHAPWCRDHVEPLYYDDRSYCQGESVVVGTVQAQLFRSEDGSTLINVESSNDVGSREDMTADEVLVLVQRLLSLVAQSRQP